MLSLGSFYGLHYVALLPLLAVSVGTVYLISTIIYNLFFHPLKSYPGPKLWAISPIPCMLMMISGQGHKKTLELHQKYGPVVRICPNQLNYSHPTAWREIAGRKAGAGTNDKDTMTFKFHRDTIIGATRQNHTRYRKKLAAGFSAQAMQDQQPLIMKYVDLLIRRLHEYGAGGTKPLDMTAWYNWTTFDVIGDLTFGEPFGGLENAAYHPWISMLFQGIKEISLGAETRRITGLEWILGFFIPAEVRRKAKEHYLITATKVKKRLAEPSNRSDFMDAMRTDKDSSVHMSLEEINANASVLVTAGSETTATALTATTYYLATHPQVLSKLVEEVRSTFNSERAINLTSVQSLKYMLAVFDESMRLFPPAPGHATRIINEGGDTILGQYIPPGTPVSVSYWATFHDPAHFTLSESFIPERWLGDPRFEGDAKSAFFPFSLGSRACLGQNLAYAEMRLILARIIWNFDIKLSEDCRDWVNHTAQYLLWEKGSLYVYLISRNFSPHGP